MKNEIKNAIEKGYHKGYSAGYADGSFLKKMPKLYSIQLELAKKSAEKKIKKQLDSQDKDDFELTLQDPAIQEYIGLVISEFLPHFFPPFGK